MFRRNLLAFRLCRDSDARAAGAGFAGTRRGALFLTCLLAAAVVAQEHHHHDGNAAELFLHEQASGTSQEAQGESPPMTMFHAGTWNVMLHGLAFFNDTRADGFRGKKATFSTNWMMVMAERSVGDGALMLRTMLSAEPFTIKDRRYPELFQTGETAFGKSIIDGQHPHDLFMELAVEYAHPAGPGMAYLYLAPVGDPALGPTAFPHRESAIEIPQATLSHHLQDSTHISSDVITAGYGLGIFRLEASSFHGAEPDENRTDIDQGRLDSASARLTITPRPNLVAQVSFGYLTKPEYLEPGDAKRTTASVEYKLPFRGGSWTSTAVWGRAYKEAHDQSLESYLAETTLHFKRRHSIALRFEDVQKDELFPHFHPSRNIVTYPRFQVPAFRVKALTLGYTLDVLTRGTARVGIGANVTAYRYPEILNLFYGPNVHSSMLYVRTRWGV